MLVKLFATNNPLILIIIFIIGILFWLNVFITPVTIPATTDIFPLYKSVFFILEGHNRLSAILAYLLVFSEGFMINYIINRDKLFSSASYLPTLLFILMMSAVKQLQTITPALMATLFLILAIKQMFDIYDEERAYSKIFKLGFFISIASLFYIPALFLVVLVFIGFIIFKLFKWREWFIFLIGLITPLIYTAVYWFLSDKLQELLYRYSDYFKNLNLGIHKFSNHIYILISISGILTLFAISKVLSGLREKLIKIRLSYFILIWFLVIALFFTFTGNVRQAYFFQFTFIPLSIILSYYIQNIRKAFIGNLIFILSILLIIASRLMF